MAKEFDSAQKYQIIYENRRLYDEMIYKCEKVYNLHEDYEEVKTPRPDENEEVKTPRPDENELLAPNNHGIKVIAPDP